MSYLSPLAAAEIASLEAEGIVLSAEDVARIDALARRVEKPQQQLTLARGKPIAIGGAVLWPMTLAASDWFQTVGCEMGGQIMQTFALAYAMAHGDKELPYDPETARTCVTAWKRKLRCRYTQLVTAIRLIHEQLDLLETVEATQQRASIADITLMMSALTGIAPAVWEYQCSIPYVLQMLDTLTAQHFSDNSSNVSVPTLKAERAIGLAIHRLRKKHRSSHAE